MRNSSTESAVCAYQHDAVTDPNRTYTCDTPLVGKEVDFIRNGTGPDKDISTLCEVIVMGHQYTGNSYKYIYMYISHLIIVL